MTPENQNVLVCGLAVAICSASVEKSEVGELLGAGICDLCGEQAAQLRVFNRAPAVGLCYCRRCAPTSETDADWPNVSRQGRREETIRPAFEEWITSSPYEREIKRWPKDEIKYAWPGQYCEITTQLAWEAWQESAFVHKLPNDERMHHYQRRRTSITGLVL